VLTVPAPAELHVTDGNAFTSSSSYPYSVHAQRLKGPLAYLWLFIDANRRLRLIHSMAGHGN
jgi:hypothetical protein